MITWILNCVSKKIHASVLYKPTAYVIWKELQDKFSQSNGPQIFQLEKVIGYLTQNQIPVIDYYTHFKDFGKNCSITHLILFAIALQAVLMVL